ncbi:hemerythrin domain-containing protein [Thiohalorhabdus denitrificans]|uniref:Hemerythrin HHE cation binding domain-containing protein n=1 Tax=Thiohalorhabdus denitrificans TaxID=381306 RepID=A0A1G5BRK6_9GAMM|nr:hemerythrin domain-containing protein [Thiohalorhabdus denitrificans]SCX92550.1 Hemerythrin HHE cation binding domain-containing protein [Thiohalorhabdus denitrificans]
MPLDDGSAPDFDTPLQLLRACHGRVERFAELAAHIADHLEEGTPPGRPVRESSGQVLRYFNQAAPLHHADEEEDLLPRLRPRLGPEEASELTALLAELAAEHEALDERWRELRPLLEALHDGRGVDRERYTEAARHFRDGQLDHVRRENAHLLPAAERLLDEEDRRALGAAMAQRRGVRHNR